MRGSMCAAPDHQCVDPHLGMQACIRASLGTLSSSSGCAQSDNVSPVVCAPGCVQRAGTARADWEHVLQSSNQNVFIKLGPYAWLCGAILFTEILVIIKFGRDEFTAPFPDHIKIAWGIFGSAVATLLVTWQTSIWVSRYFNRNNPKQVGAKKSQ